LTIGQLAIQDFEEGDEVLIGNRAFGNNHPRRASVEERISEGIDTGSTADDEFTPPLAHLCNILRREAIEWATIADFFSLRPSENETIAIAVEGQVNHINGLIPETFLQQATIEKGSSVPNPVIAIHLARNTEAFKGLGEH
jgi:hypothetical protein